MPGHLPPPSLLAKGASSSSPTWGLSPDNTSRDTSVTRLGADVASVMCDLDVASVMGSDPDVASVMCDVTWSV